MSLAMKHPHRHWPLRALNLELSQVRDTARNDLAGLVRFRWFKDQVGAMFDESQEQIRADGTVKGTGHPVLDCLKMMVYADGVSL